MRLHRRIGLWASVLGVMGLVCFAGPRPAEAKLLELQLRVHGGGLAGVFGTGEYDPANSTDAQAAAGEDFFKSRRGGCFGGTLNVEVLFVDLTYEFYQLANGEGLGSTLNNFLVGFDWDFRTGRKWVITPYILAGFGLATQNNSWLSKSYPQIALADEIGSNDGYQDYLIKLRDVEKSETVGVEQAKALQDAGIKVIVNSGDVQGGMDSLLDLITTKGGTNVAGMLEAIRQTDEGAALLSRVGIDGKES